jgi:hypothetical protein
MKVTMWSRTRTTRDTVDVLLEQGKVEEARAEFERLILEGVDSGPAIEVTAQFWDDFRAELKQRAERHK